ncbi:Hypothetical protein PBC10988_0050 [Planctomycetales bacterium 10988]|nr:Hypothetical protein PBC10988_0050 [Planctomycetales bacterium 10988]
MNAFSSLVVLQNPQREEFADALGILQDHSHVEIVSQLSEGKISSGENLSPDFILLCQEHPNEFSKNEIESWRQELPLARWAILYGSWCEGELRTGHPPEGISRWPWYEGKPRLEMIFQGWQRNQITELDRPVTETPLEKSLLYQSFQYRNFGDWAILHDQGVQNNWLVACCRQEKISAISFANKDSQDFETWLKSRATPPGILWDTDRFDERSFERLKDWLSLTTEQRLIVLSHFPRWQDRERIRDFPNASLLGKPFALDLLFHCMSRPVYSNPIS